MSRIVITGGPGAGKTTLLLALRDRGHSVAGDSARAIIQERRSRGLSPRPDAQEFVYEILQRDMANFAQHAATPGHVFFDRSVVDALGGLDGVAPLGETELGRWLANYPYFPTVFLLPPWPAIYVNDAERDQPFAHAEAVDRSLRAWYRRCSYRVIEVPRVPVAERCTHVLRALADSAA